MRSQLTVGSSHGLDEPAKYLMDGGRDGGRKMRKKNLVGLRRKRRKKGKEER